MECLKMLIKKTLYVDMDNVLVDFQSGIDRLPPELLEEYRERGFDEVPGIFALMEPLEGAVEAYNKLSGIFDTYILSTAPWHNLTAASDKVAWVKRYLDSTHKNGVAYKRLIISHQKNLLRGDFLIDDRPNNGAKDFVGQWLQFGSPKYPDWDTVLEYLVKKA